MGVVGLFLKVTDWCILLIGWILCIPLRIQLNVLRWINPHLVASITTSEKKSKCIPITSPPDVQAFQRELQKAIEDKKHEGAQYIEMKKDASNIKLEWLKESESDSSGFKETNDTNLKHQLAKLKEELEDAHANLKSLQQEKDILQQANQKEVDVIRQGVDGDVKQLHQKDSNESALKIKASLSSENTNLKRQLAKLKEEIENAHEKMKS